MSKSTTTKVILPTREIKQVQEPTKVAELMMETPNFFIVNTKTLKIGRRFCPLNADEDLEMGNVYAMLPMHRKNSVATAKDLASLFITANSAFKRVSQRKGRVQPEVVVDEHAAEVTAVPRLSLEGVEEVSTVEFMHRLSMSRSKKPLLETIEEEPAGRPRKGINC